jgi:hypothetical protein
MLGRPFISERRGGGECNDRINLSLYNWHNSKNVIRKSSKKNLLYSLTPTVNCKNTLFKNVQKFFSFHIKTPWPGSASELYQPSGRHLSAMLVSTIMDRGVPRGQSDGSLRPYSRISRPEPLLCLPSSSSVVLPRLCGPLSRPTTSQKIR